MENATPFFGFFDFFEKVARHGATFFVLRRKIGCVQHSGNAANECASKRKIPKNGENWGFWFLGRKIEGGGKRGKRKIDDFMSNISTVTGGKPLQNSGSKTRKWLYINENAVPKIFTTKRRFWGARERTRRKWGRGGTVGHRRK